MTLRLDVLLCYLAPLASNAQKTEAGGPGGLPVSPMCGEPDLLVIRALGGVFSSFLIRRQQLRRPELER